MVSTHIGFPTETVIVFIALSVGAIFIDLFMHRDDLELDEDTYFIQDLIDMEVKDADSGFVYGKITDVLQNGANDVYVIKGDREYLVPAIPDVVISTDIDSNIMLIRPLEGLFD